MTITISLMLRFWISVKGKWDHIVAHEKSFAVVASLIQIIGLPLILWQLYQIGRSPDLHLEFTRTQGELCFSLVNHESVVAELPQAEGNIYLISFAEIPRLNIVHIDRDKPLPQYVRANDRSESMPFSYGYSFPDSPNPEQAFFVYYYVSCKNCPKQYGYWLMPSDAGPVIAPFDIGQLNTDSLSANPYKYIDTIVPKRIRTSIPKSP